MRRRGWKETLRRVVVRLRFVSKLLASFGFHFIFLAFLLLPVSVSSTAAELPKCRPLIFPANNGHIADALVNTTSIFTEFLYRIFFNYYFYYFT